MILRHYGGIRGLLLGLLESYLSGRVQRLILMVRGLRDLHSLHRAWPNGTCECRRRVTCPMDDSWCRLGIGCHRKPSRVGSRSSCPAGSGLRRPGGVRELRLMT
ncbi:hypothetical protein EVAR_92406_1 [Eumeta japonica]|uniref:Uncharacterized protein n=1 Tax=Eumeta variegata TaxID=151549 RepID=A0A4C1TM74_EUMVA|nr:hypothetical protein EVAR_92406_1 [Eumeta japonica]